MTTCNLHGEQLKNFTHCVAFGLANLPSMPTKDYVTKKAKEIAEIFGYQGNIDACIAPILDKLRVLMRTNAGFAA